MKSSNDHVGSPSDLFPDVPSVQRGLRAEKYEADLTIATSVYLMHRLEKPLLIEGPAGVGKTELAKALSRALGRSLIRLQCYEGLGEDKALYEWEYTKQLLYTQLLKEKVDAVIAGAATLEEAVRRLQQHDSAFFSEHFLVPRPLLQAILSPEPTVLLIDEVDRSDEEFEAFLLEILSDFQVTIPELGTLRARSHPWVILTSNATRSLSDALRRRCLYLPIDFPDFDRECAIVRQHLPDIDETLLQQVVRFVQGTRELQLRKHPSVSETIDWAAALCVLHVDQLSRRLVNDTLSTLLKDREDIERVIRENLRW